MKYAKIINGNDRLRDQIAAEIEAELVKHHFQEAAASEDLKFIFNLVDFDHPKVVRRKAQSEFVVSLISLPVEVENLRFFCYNTLIQTLSNLVLCIKPNGTPKPEIYCITPEAGFYHFNFSPEKTWEAMRPIVNAHFVIDNHISFDLPPAYVKTEITEQLRHYGVVLDQLGLLPTPFDLRQLLSQESIDHVYRLFKLTGLSYGNLSARESIPGFNPNTFWMTARGVNKANLQGVGQDILLVTGYDAESGNILASIPKDGKPRIRVSVDAIEHTLIYQALPDVGAIVHVHGWMKDVPCTHQNAPCGTIELARDVVRLLKTTDRPERAIVGLKNHGLTITGASLEEIFSRIKGKLLKEVPMMP
jgi:ribulose-5-phosphate 4-epimerase/fuculose-1-phosphate aldolase